MEKIDQELLQGLSNSNFRLNKLYQEHLKLEKEIQRYERWVQCSQSAALHQKELKKQKLQGMDEIMAILNHYRHDSERMAVNS